MIKRLATILKFGVVGLMNTAVDAAVFLILTAAGVPALAAQAVSYGCGVLNSYWWNGRWTFRDADRREGGSELVRFIIINLLVLAGSTFLLFLLNSVLGWSLWISKTATTMVGMLINYMASRYWVFAAGSERTARRTPGANERRA